MELKEIIGLVIFGGIVTFFVYAVFQSKTVPCPSCGFKMLHIKGSYAKCPNCKAYSQYNEGGPAPVPQDMVAGGPVFELALFPGCKFPDVCCFCGGNATDVAVGPQQLYGYSTGAMLTQGVFHAIVPYCDRCSDGTEVVKEKKSGNKMDSYYWNARHRVIIATNLGMKVCSYRFYREFLRINRIGSA